MSVFGRSKKFLLGENIERVACGVRIGVLGGIGPEATGEFYTKLIQELQQKGLIRSNADFPQIVINSIPAPELVQDKISDEELRPYINGLRELDRFGVDFIVMVCNTIHLYYDRLQSEINTPILNLKEKMREMLKKRGTKSALVIGTPNTIRRGLYKFKEIQTFIPNRQETNQLSKAILNFNKGFEKDKQKEKARKICEKYMTKGAETVILGCTEFAVMLNEEIFPKINTIEVLVEATLENMQPHS